MAGGTGSGKTKECTCDYCEAMRMYERELYKRMILLINKYMEEQRDIPTTESVQNTIMDELQVILINVHSKIALEVNDLLDRMGVPKEAPEEPKTPENKTLN